MQTPSNSQFPARSSRTHARMADSSECVRFYHGSDFFTELLRQFFKCWTIEERRTFGWIVIPPLGNPPVGVLGDLVF